MSKKKTEIIEDLNLDFEAWAAEQKYKGPLAGLYLSTAELAELFTVTPKTVRSWHDKGYIFPEGPNKWHVPEVVRGLYRTWRDMLDQYGGKL